MLLTHLPKIIPDKALIFPLTFYRNSERISRRLSVRSNNPAIRGRGEHSIIDTIFPIHYDLGFSFISEPYHHQIIQHTDKI